MDKPFRKDFELSESEKEKWARHFMMCELYEEGVEIEEILRIVGIPVEEIDDYFPKIF